MILVSVLPANDEPPDMEQSRLRPASPKRWRTSWIMRRFWRDLEIVLRWIFLDARERRAYPLASRIRGQDRTASLPPAAQPVIAVPTPSAKREVLVAGRAKFTDRVLRCLLSEDVNLHAIATDMQEWRDLAAMGVTPHRLQDMAEQAAKVDVIVSTDLLQFISADVLARLPERAVVLDLAPPPGSVDYESAKKLGRTAIWARSAISEGRPVFCPETWAKVRRALNKSRNGG